MVTSDGRTTKGGIEDSALAWPCRRSLRAAYSDHSSLPPAARIRWPFVYNVQLDRLCFLVAPVHATLSFRLASLAALGRSQPLP